MQFAHGGVQAPVLTLALHYSSLLDTSGSTLTVEVDGQSVDSVRLSDIPEDGLYRVSLGVQVEGFHLLRVRTNLSIADDPCLERFGRDAWVRLLSASSLKVTRPTPEDSLERLGEEWASFESVHVDTLFQRPDAQLAALETLGLLQQWGLTAHLQPFSYADTPQWIVRSLEDAPFDEPMLEGLAEELQEASSELRSAVLATEFALVVLGRTDKDAQHATAELHSTETRRLCPRIGTCWFGAAQPQEGHEPEVSTDEDEVLHLSDIGHSHGWVAEGSGRHVLRFVWTRPRDWNLLRAPEVHLRIRHATESFLSPERSSVTLKLADRPIATWRLNGATGEERILMAKVPESDWEDDAWAFEVVVQLRHQDGRCDEGEGWLSVEASSALVVERDQAMARGLNAFFEGTQTERPGIVGALSTEGLERFAGLVGPFVSATPGQQWQWAGDATRSNIRMGGDAHSAEFDTVHAAEVERWLQNGSGPALDRASTDMLILNESDDGATLLIVPGHTADEELEAPQYPYWNANVALRHDGEWHLNEEESVDGERERVERDEVTTLPRLASELALRHEHIQRVWMVGLVLSLLLGAGWLGWRRRQRTAA